VLRADLQTGDARPIVSETKGVPALVRAVKLMDAIVASERPLTISNIARQLAIPKSTVHGICCTLVELGLLTRNNANSYLIGPHVMRWANAFVAQSNLTAEFYELLHNLRGFADETFTLSVLDGQEVVYLACWNSASSLGVTFRIGMRLPAPFTATGKAILSGLPNREVRRLLHDNWPTPLTRNSVRDIDELERELDLCRERGFSIDNGQTREGMYCFGTSVRDSSNTVVAGIAISLLAERVNEPTTRKVAACIQMIAHDLSSRLGASRELSNSVGK
jgi:DNA-binding IclR family transcriptional regulator